MPDILNATSQIRMELIQEVSNAKALHPKSLPKMKGNELLISALFHAENLSKIEVTNATKEERSVKHVKEKEGYKISISVAGEQKEFIVSKSTLKKVIKELHNDKAEQMSLEAALTPRERFEISYPSLMLDTALKARLDEMSKLSDQFEFREINPMSIKEAYWEHEARKQYSDNREDPPRTPGLPDEDLCFPDAEKNFKNAEFRKELINDLILFSCLVPIKLTEKGGNRVQCQTIDVLPIRRAEILLNNLSLSSMLPSIDPDKYRGASLFQKMVMLNMGNFRSGMQKRLIDDPFFQEFMQTVDKNGSSAAWMFACSGAVEQSYLNTCVGAAESQKILSHTLVLPQAIIMIETVLEKIEHEIATCKSDKEKEYMTQRVSYEKKFLEQLKQDVLKAAKENTTDKLGELTQRWSNCVQRLGLLTRVDALGHPTKKIIRNHWLISLILMIPVIIFKHLFNIGYNPPSIKMRAMGSYGGIAYNIISPSVNSVHGPNTSFSDRWKTLRNQGGNVLYGSGHNYFLKAIEQDGQKMMLVSDPKQNDYQIMNEKMFIKFSQEIEGLPRKYDSHYRPPIDL